jgi:hypothetical protein
MSRNIKYADHDLTAIAGLTDSERDGFDDAILDSSGRSNKSKKVLQRQGSEVFTDGGDDEDDSSHVSPNSSSFGSFSSSSRRMKKDDNTGENASLKIAQRENIAVHASKMAILAVLILITIGASIAVFVYVDQKEVSDFTSNLEEDAYKIFSDVSAAIVERFSQLDELALAMVSYANLTSSVWPLVTVPNFAVRASKARSISSAVAIETFPFVTDVNEKETEGQDRKTWEAYAKANGIEWVMKSLAVQAVDESYYGEQPSDDITVKPRDIWYDNEIVPPESGP